MFIWSIKGTAYILGTDVSHLGSILYGPQEIKNRHRAWGMGVILQRNAKKAWENVARLQHKPQELRRLQHQLEEYLCRNKSAEKHWIKWPKIEAWFRTSFIESELLDSRALLWWMLLIFWNSSLGLECVQFMLTVVGQGNAMNSTMLSRASDRDRFKRAPIKAFLMGMVWWVLV